MRVLVVFNHPYDGSYCSALLKAVLSGLEGGGHEADLIHLDKDEFDPVMRAKDLKAFVIARSNPEESLAALDPMILDYKARMEQADHIVFIFPIWWELMPALMKGFVDKVIFPGITYHYSDSGKRLKCILPKLSGVTMVTTMNTPGWIYRFVFGNAIKKALLLGTFWKLGVANRKWICFNDVKFVKPEKREMWLSQTETAMRKLK